jgi:hypothetical protein
MRPSVVYIAQGKINLLEPGRPPRLIESKFGQSVIDRAAQIQQRNVWKTQGTGAKFMSGRMLWGGGQEDPTAIPMAVTGISFGTQSGELVYSIATHEITGVFALRNKATEEQRLFHTADFRIGQLSAHPQDDRIACVVQGRGLSNIAVMRGDGSELTELTQGDCLDRAPSWVPGSSSELLYQSSGVARDQQGNNLGASPARIERLNLESGEITTLLADEHYDYLDPHMDGEGNLYCIRKPSASMSRKFRPLRALLDLILLPLRILYALFQYLNFFTVRYTGNPLVTSGDARQKRADLRQMMLLGNIMQAQRDTEGLFEREKGGLVAKTWELVKKPLQGDPQVLERGVLSFDICGDGSILYTDGNRIFFLRGGESKETLGKDEFISQVLALPELEPAPAPAPAAIPNA